MSEHGVARDQLRAFIERIERLEEEKKTIADDIKDVKAEAKGCGFDVGIINAVIKLRKVDANERAERDAMLDTYLIALGMLPEPADDDDDFDAATGEFLNDNEASDGSPSVSATLAARVAEESAVSHSPETANEHPHHLKTTRGDESGTLEGSVEDHGQAAGRSPESQMDGETDPVTAGETAPHTDQPLKGGDEDPRAVGEPTSKTGEGAASALPTKSKLRPHCQNPGQTCGGYGDKHCHDCLRSMRESEAA